MSIHSNKYYQLIKVIRTQKQQTQQRKHIREQLKVKRREDQNKSMKEEHIASIIDRDNSVQLDSKDQITTRKDQTFRIDQKQYGRLWELFSNVSAVFKLSREAQTIQVKISRNKDQQLIDSMLKESRIETQKIGEQIELINVKMAEELQQLLLLRKQLFDQVKEREQCDKEVVKLKAQFDADEKKINERSMRFKEEKSKDIMIKNINKEDQQMRRAMISRIKMNQELDFGFQLQRKRAFNQAKQAITQKKTKINQQILKTQKKIDNFSKSQNALKQQKLSLQKQTKICQKQTAYFLKHLIKHFHNHSRGIEWMANMLTQCNQQIQKQDLPQQIATEDKQFIQNIFKQRGKDKQKMIRTGRVNHSQSMIQHKNVTQTPFKNKIKLYHQFKTEPNIRLENDQTPNIGIFDNTHPDLQRAATATVYFDIENTDHSPSNFPSSRKQFKTKFDINSKSLRKIYNNTSEVISTLIKDKDWNYESCKVMTAPSQQEHTPINFQRKIIQQKIKMKFMNVRQFNRRNNMKQLLFGPTTTQ